MSGKVDDKEGPGEVGRLRARVADLEAVVAEHEASTRRLAQSEERLRTLLENSPDSITVMDVDGRMVYLNRTAPTRRLEEVIGTRASAYLPEPHAARFDDALKGVVRTGEAHTIEVKTVADSWWETRLLPLTRDGRVTAVMGIGADVTERRRVAAALRESEARLRIAVEASRMGLWSWDPVTDVIALDVACAAMAGFPAAPQTTSSQDLIGAMHVDDKEKAAEAARTLTETGGMQDVEVRVLGRDGIWRWLLVSGKRVDAGDGAEVRLIGSGFDITERKRLEEQLRQAQKMEAVGQLTAGIAHNFNNLLTAIIPTIQLVRREVPADVGERLLDAEYAATRAADLIKQLMVFARQHRQAARQPTDLREMLHRTASICRATFDRSIELELADGMCAPPVMGEAGQLEQVFLNICINARDAVEASSPEHRRIRVALDRAPREPDGAALGDWVRVRISDNGPGMTEEVRARVFDPFFTTKDIGRGTGLGLATAYAIVAAHGGRLLCESQPGAGTTFTVLLPAADRTVVPAARAAKPGAGGTETILVIDDERGVRSAVRSVLEAQGYTVQEAADGPSGLELFRRAEGRIDLVLLDLSMPGIPGDAVLANILRERPGTRVVLLSGYQPPVVPPGAVAMLQKPFELEELVRVVREVCDGGSRS
jgi:two-component system cell cycle sensor histidine kinase/response regulator CckA